MKTLAEYSTDKGKAWLVQGEKYFGVVCRIQTGPGSWRIRERGLLTHEGALEIFAEFQAELDGRSYVKQKCKYSAKRTRPCNSHNCPAKLGGADYWAIFSNSCCYKTR